MYFLLKTDSHLNYRKPSRYMTERYSSHSAIIHAASELANKNDIGPGQKFLVGWGQNESNIAGFRAFIALESDVVVKEIERL